MARVVVTGAAGPLGRRVVEHLLAHPEVASVVAVDVLDPGPTAADVRRADLVSADLGPLLDGADAVIHLASTFGPPIAGSEIEAAPNVAMARRVLVMNQSRLVMDGTVDEVFSKASQLFEMGLSVPQITEVFLRLKEKGYPVRTDIYTAGAAAKELKRVMGGGADA